MANKKDLPQWVLNKYKRDVEYQKKFVKQLKVKLYRNTEQDIIDYIESIPNKSGYIKELIKKDMKKHGG